MKKVVVIGGGFAGSLIAKKLEKKFGVTLIDTKNYFEFTPSVLRSIVEPEHFEKIQILHSEYLKKSRIIIGEVTEVNKKFIRVNGKKIDFDYLAICSGSRYEMPFKEQDIIVATRAEHLRKYFRRLKDAKKVVIVGGGLAGVELAGEILGKYPDKKLVIVHVGRKLMERNSPEASAYSELYLKKKGAEILFGTRIAEVKKDFCVTDNGEKIKRDLVFICTGIKPNFELLKSFDNVLNEKNQVKVNEFLQVNGFENIFAAGDLTNVAEEKTAQNAEREGRIVVRNILALDSGRELKKHESRKTMSVISLGKWNGILDNGKFVFTGIIPAFIKKFVEMKEMWEKRYF
jgi:apoptosis-inducing factor 2